MKKTKKQVRIIYKIVYIIILKVYFIYHKKIIKYLEIINAKI